MARKVHLAQPPVGGPACKNGRVGAALRGSEHITMRYAEFAAALEAAQCRGGRLFAFLARAK